MPLDIVLANMGLPDAYSFYLGNVDIDEPSYFTLGGFNETLLDGLDEPVYTPVIPTYSNLTTAYIPWTLSSPHGFYSKWRANLTKMNLNDQYMREIPDTTDITNSQMLWGEQLPTPDLSFFSKRSPQTQSST
mmetsp:Transcript_11212/g.20580  ORF Transcript_11212/g.20580 Transcript_11212/m.20580 type:complete len:132 (+) Transcript_11212:277-672(+)